MSGFNRCLLFIRTRHMPFLLAFLLLRMDHSWPWRRWSWKSTSSPGPLFSSWPCPWESSKQVFEQDKVCSEVQNCDPDFLSYSYLLGTWTPHLMVTTAKGNPNLHSPNQFLLVYIRSVRTSPLTGSSITCIISALQKPPRLFVSCSLPFQQVSEWLNSPTRTRSWKHEASSSCLQQGSSTFSWPECQ